MSDLLGNPQGLLLEALKKASFVIPGMQPMGIALEAIPTSKGEETPTVGSQKTDSERGTVLYAGKDYGYQSPESYKKIFGALPASYKPPGSSRSGDTSASSEGAGSSGTSGEPDWTQGRSSGEAPAPSTLPPSTTGEIPQTGVDYKPLEKLLERFESKRGEYIQQDLESALQRMLVTNMLSMRQTRENTARQVELKNIEAWQNIERARIEANARQAAALAQTAYLSQIPNAGVMTAMNEASKGAMAPFEGFSLK